MESGAPVTCASEQRGPKAEQVGAGQRGRAGCSGAEGQSRVAGAR